MPEKLSAKQEEILEFIKQEILSRGYPPSVRDICQAVGLKSTSSVHAHLEKLEEYGYIRRDPAKSRTIEILDDTFGAQRKDMVNVPEVGTVAAGMPLLAEQNITDYIPIPAEMLPNAETFILRVRGESMINAGIFNNDRLIVERQNTARNGEIVVALIDDGATVKRFYKEKGHVRLQPENDAMDPIIVSDCRFLGKVVGLFRTDIR